MFPKHVFIEYHSTQEQDTVLKFLKTFSIINRILKMQIFDKCYYYNVIIPGYQMSL